MKEALFPFFEWAETSLVGEGIRSSQWLFPVIEAFHLVAFAALGGAILLVDLRLLGLTLKTENPADLARSARPWFYGAIAVMVTSGGLLFLSESIKLYYNDPFWAKMRFLGLGLLFTFTVRRWIIGADQDRVGHWPKIVGLVNIFLWSGVAWGGRWIGFWG